MEQKIELFSGVCLRGVQTGRFKSACLSCSFLRPLRREEAAKNALLANVLIQGTQTHPDLQSISRALDSLYGASLGPLVRKNGQIQTWGFYLSFLEDRFALEDDRVLEPVTELLGEVLLRPRLEGGVFVPAWVEREKENLISTIEAAVNDKRVYADRQMLRAMCRDDGFGAPRLGEPEDVAAVTPEELGLLDHVAALPESQRTVLHLHYYEGYTLREIARLLGVTVPTVKMRLKRGRDALRNTWEESL